MATRAAEDGRPGPVEPGSAWVADRVEELVAAWRSGERATAGDVLARHPGLGGEAAVRLIYEEVCLRRESGEEVATAEVVARYPRWKAELERLLSCDRLLRPRAPARFPDVGGCLGEFRLLSELGRGAAGRTYLAAQAALADRPVVLKVAPLDHEEHLCLARLQHTHIVPLYSEQVFPERGLRALCLPFLGGASLARILDDLAEVPAGRRLGRDLLRAVDRAPAVADGPYRQLLRRASYVQATCWIAACLADALRYAHDHGLVHMDVKPSNVLIAGDGQPMLLDFHLARDPVVPGGPAPERLGGTPGWMAPEQRAAMEAVADGRPVAAAVDGRADIYALGLLVYEALGGPGAVEDGKVRARLHRLNPEVSVGLSDIVHKCLAADPSGRYGDAGALADDLRRHLGDLPLRGVPNRSPAERWRKWRRRARPRGVARLSTLLLALLAVLPALAYYRQRIGAIATALEAGRRSLDARRFAEAARAFDEGLALARWTPAAGRLARDLETGRRRSLRARKAWELHRLMDVLRFRYGLAPPPEDELRPLVRLGRAIWDGEGAPAHAGDATLGPEAERAFRADLGELAIFLADVRARRSSPGEAAEARREALRLLDEATARLGPSPALDRERLAHLAASGHADAAGVAVPPPRSAAEFYDLGRSHLRAGQVARADEAFRRAIALRPESFWPNFYQGLCAYRLGRFEEAVAAFRACIALSPRVAECYYNRAIAQEALGRVGPATEDYGRALELDPALAPAALNRGVLSYNAGRYLDAIADYTRGLDASTSRSLSGRLYLNLAMAQLARRDRRAAATSLESAIRLGDRDAPALRDRLRDDP
jgi:eukaryotic-like serine/threonine-protein kinase